MRFVIFFIFIICSVYASSVTKGEALLLEVDREDTLSYKDGKIIELLAHPVYVDKKIALIPINYKSSSSSLSILKKTPQGIEELEYKIEDGEYKKERLSVDPKKVSPPKEVLDRISKEYSEAMAIYGDFSSPRAWSEPFATPMDSTITSQFGNARMFNDTLKSYHSGTDFRAAIGTPIRAVNDGVVALASERYYAGGSIIIDHGEGIYSQYYHLSAMDKKRGDRVKKGEVIGKSGVSGRVTGPHLHYGIMVRGVQVNPMKFTEQINALF
ncbi:MAG: M23 family metallopeptidase [Campylobacterales bacterium]